MDATKSLIQPTFLFEDRKRFTAECEHDRLRSSINSEIELSPTTDPWKQRPVDFTMKSFHPNRKKERISPRMNQDFLSKDKTSEFSRIDNPVVMRPFAIAYEKSSKKHGDQEDDDEFSLDTRIKYQRIPRMLNTEQYKNPKPHDFRQYPDIKQLGLSEFQTDYDRDPYNIRFLSDHLNTLWLQERANECVPQIEKPLSELHRVLTARPKWDSRLILPKLAFPNKYAAYTRYRNPNRTIQSAYWERVENRFDQTKTRLNII